MGNSSADAPGAPRNLSIQDALDLAVSHHEQGRLQVAGQIYHSVLSADPDNAVALNLSGVVAVQMKQPERAVELIGRALKVQPDYVEAHGNLGLALIELDRLDEAVASFEQALALDPQSADAHCNLGNALFRMKSFSAAADSYRRALEIEPNSFDVLCNLANTMLAEGAVEDALAQYQESLAVNPNHFDAHLGLGKALLKQGQGRLAFASFERALALKPDSAEARNNMAGAFAAMAGGEVDAIANVKVDPAAPAANLVLSKALAGVVPRWHVPMMNDAPRNAAYLAALEAAVSGDVRVLEIGTGSGLLAMMAARLSAKHVTTCEAVPLIAHTAERIVADNGLSDAITVIAKPSTQLRVGEDMDEPADLLVSEILSSELISEGVLASVEDARRRLLKKDARIIPAASAMMIAAFGGDDIGMNLRVGEVCGFDLGRFNQLAARKFALHRNDLDVELLSEAAAAFTFDFQNTAVFPPERKTIRLQITSPGDCHGIIQWNRIDLDGTNTFENHPSNPSPASAWNHAVYVFDEVVSVKPGDELDILAVHDRMIPWFSLVGR